MFYSPIIFFGILPTIYLFGYIAKENKNTKFSQFIRFAIPILEAWYIIFYLGLFRFIRIIGPMD